MKNPIKYFYLCFAVFVLNTTAFAQTVEEVTVTATRKSESLQDIALSVQSLEDELLESTHIETSRDLAILVPGLTFASGTGSGSATRTVSYTHLTLPPSDLV